eukprot:TRINITY_DN6984_c2_g2_i2.p4 TRINITY_DN6984_c2_g2~~TRINITY_DN6984_c2_g2_i2.p4  ORF type:complete len:107 (-),score=3.73 TRINITY_DN6984_c2_g2_i2:528-848(-)
MLSHVIFHAKKMQTFFCIQNFVRQRQITMNTEHVLKNVLFVLGVYQKQLKDFISIKITCNWEKQLAQLYGEKFEIQNARCEMQAFLSIVIFTQKMQINAITLTKLK